VERRIMEGEKRGGERKGEEKREGEMKRRQEYQEES
jgi:hypothetical protein